MHRPTQKIRPLVGGVLLILALSPASAEDANPKKKDMWSGWTPSVTVGVGIYSADLVSRFFGGFAGDIQKTDLTLPNTGTDIYGVSNAAFCDGRLNLVGADPCVLPLGNTNSASLAGAVVPLSLEFLSPEIEQLAGKPRAFIHAGYGFPQGIDKELGTVRAIKELNPTGTRVDPIGSMEIFGIADATPKGLWWVGAGLSFDVPLSEYKVAIKPSINYYGDRIKHLVSYRELLAQYPTPGTTPITGANQQRFKQYYSQTDVFHALAPGLGLSVDLGRRGPILIGVYADALVPIYLSNRTIGFSRISTAVPPRNENSRVPAPTGNDAARVGVPRRGELRQTYDRYSIVAHAGLRFSWVGDR